MQGSLSILNGGALKKLEGRDINYYYDNMDSVVKFIRKPLDEYTEYQKVIASEIIKIGGSGRIHGCIIDIDYFNHIYVNPVDMKVTGYWALDMIHKKVYPNVQALLKRKCPELYGNYSKFIENEKESKLMENKTINEVDLLPRTYLATDIYKASREIKKMQKLSSNVLSIWYDIASK